MTAETTQQRPIGVFDSGIGGLSVLRALQAELPHERFVYVADSGYAPYGERGDPYVAARSHAITRHLQARHGIKALVVACNTATAAAIHEVRTQCPDLPLVGLEPAIKPAVALSRTRRIGVIGTRGTLTSSKFALLLGSLQSQADFVVQPCDGLAYAIEQSTEHAAPPLSEASKVRALCEQYLGAMGAFGTAEGCIDTLVLGCTHYVFAEEVLRALVGDGVRLVDTGEPVARQTRRLLEATGLLAAADDNAASPSHERVQLLTTGALPPLQAAAHRWLQLPVSCCSTAAVPTPGVLPMDQMPNRAPAQ
ncbi:glutamate racemase [Acidovorax sp. SUPP3334]|uniref:glutamate racemase n=1 Tax=Acidovorax sp. SUPP3334 TaxID=2920881 RepID=UPI0023DE2991|nr:glutamate racemase [Acidovorax sp. SUPP3334]GKT26482.1 glutamate racemase [Acidovorax sp. SUPP3334]